MAEFSKSINGNFEKLAESLNEDLMPVLEELKETLNKIPEKIDTNAASVSQSVAAYAAPAVGPSTQYGMTAQVQRENPNMSKEDVQKVVDKRLNEQARAQSQSLESKFDELIELLKSGMARVSLT
jgi:division protein CdvB (Snf7/Vps24/ESCRT-III family)